MKLLKLSLAVAAVLLSLATLLLPAAALWIGLEIGAHPERVSRLWSTSLMRELSLGLFPGPVTTLGLSILMLLMVAGGRRIPSWVVLIGLVGTAFTAKLPSGIGHDFSHIIFNSCSGYGEAVFWLCVGLGTCLLFLGDFPWKNWVRRFHAWRLGEGLDEAGAKTRSD